MRYWLGYPPHNHRKATPTSAGAAPAPRSYGTQPDDQAGQRLVDARDQLLAGVDLDAICRSTDVPMPLLELMRDELGPPSSPLGSTSDELLRARRVAVQARVLPVLAVLLILGVVFGPPSLGRWLTLAGVLLFVATWHLARRAADIAVDLSRARRNDGT